MAEYKCIYCGETKESEKTCGCSNCGYKMFEMPFDRKEVLIQEITSFLNCLKIDTIEDHLLSYYRLVPPQKKIKDISEEEQFDIITKEKDDQRFPDFDKIRDYACGAQKTEIFYERISTTIEQIRKHIHTPYDQEYKVSADRLKGKVGGLEAIMKASLKVLQQKDTVAEFIVPEIFAHYYEIPNENLLDCADEILNTLSQLIEKIQKYIKQNNLYGTAYQYHPKKKYSAAEVLDHSAEMNNTLSALNKVLGKQFVVDIFSDGIPELKTMLKELWYAIEILMTAPLLKKKYVYEIEELGIFEDSKLFEKMLELITVRYAKIPIYCDNSILEDKTEDVLFEYYDKLIELDSFGFMGVSSENLIKIGESEKDLQKLIGLSSVKESIKKIKAYAVANKNSEGINLHMCFYGNPGTGKTEVARIIAGILYENKILPSNHVVEVDRGGLVGRYVGETPYKTMGKINEAMGGVLFIDEAYSLIPKDGGDWDYGHEAIATLLKAMEDYRGKFCVVLAGYKNQMETMLSSNPGFKSRIQFYIDFPNYSRGELGQITSLMLNKRGYTANDAVAERILDITDVKRKDPNFANAREIRNILDQVIMCQNLRCLNSDDKELGLADVNRYINDANLKLPTGSGEQKKILTGEDELDQLIGLSSVKRMIKKIKAYAKRNQHEDGFNLHMCFYGNPGTGKTEVARILSRILYDAGVLPEAKLIETDAHGLIGKYVGETGPKTLAKINDAMNGVLFIDEAYGLCGSATGEHSASYGEEAISVLIKEMEDRRGKFCTILAGYKDEMQDMISINPGLKSRIQFTLDFPDYTREELQEIALAFLNKKKYDIEDDALDRILDITEYFRKKPNFANARTIRNIIDQVIMNQNLRAEDSEDDYLIIIDDVEDYIMDEGIDFKEPQATRRIGF